MRFLIITSSLFLTILFGHVSYASGDNDHKQQQYQNQQLTSPATQVSLIELYTSEGCNSCPPAEHWLNSLKTSKNLWNDFVPVAFHVDYWDYIGWKDVYAKPEHTKRQRIYAIEGREPAIYTPGVRAEGREWRHWRRANMERLADAERDEVGVLRVDIAADGTFNAEYRLPEGKTLEQLNVRGEPYFLTVALLGMDIDTDVKRGENRGKTLEHDFIVLQSNDYERQAGLAKGVPQAVSWQGQLPKSEHQAPQYAIAAWVTSNKSLKPIQATGAFLP